MNRASRGFTIIEVLIVLAIASLILLVVFLAVPALQRNSRNYERRRADEVIVTQIAQYRAINGKTPVTVAEGTAFVNDFAKETASRYTVTFRDNNAPHSDKPNYDEIFVQYGHWCSANHGGADTPGDLISSAPGSHTSNNYYAVFTKLENNFYHCVDNG